MTENAINKLPLETIASPFVRHERRTNNFQELQEATSSSNQTVHATTKTKTTKTKTTKRTRKRGRRPGVKQDLLALLPGGSGKRLSRPRNEHEDPWRLAGLTKIDNDNDDHGGIRYQTRNQGIPVRRATTTMTTRSLEQDSAEIRRRAKQNDNDKDDEEPINTLTKEEDELPGVKAPSNNEPPPTAVDFYEAVRLLQTNSSSVNETTENVRKSNNPVA